jgi:hypothetical protein
MTLPQGMTLPPGTTSPQKLASWPSPVVPACGSMFTAAHRANQSEKLDPVVSEQDLYGK